MNYKTELMQEILTNEKAQEIIDYVSQIYGNSYVGLWFYQTIGSVLGPICDLSDQLMLETSPATATLLLSYYEQEYGISVDPTMSLDQRREAVVAAMRSKGSCTPVRLADSVSASLGGVPVEIIEYNGTSLALTYIDNLVVYEQKTGQDPTAATSIWAEDIDNLVVNGQTTGQLPEWTSVTADEIDQIVIYETQLPQGEYLTKNEFIVNIRAAVDSTAPAVAVIDRMKPAHLIYTIRGVTQETVSADVTIGAALTTAELFKVEVQS